jgi:PAS domain S-box-containing protein
MLELIYETMSDGVAVFDLSGRVVFCNPAMCLLAGRSVEQIVGKTPREAWGSSGGNYAASAALTTMEERIQRPDGTEKLVTVKTFALGSDPPYRVHIHRDVTKMREARRALEDSYRVLHAFMAGNPAMATIKDELGRYVYVNPATEELFNRPMAEWIGKTDGELWDPWVADEIEANDRAVRETGEAMHFEEVYPVGTKERHFLTHRFLVHDAHGKHLLASLSLDVTLLIKRENEAAHREQVMEVLLDVMATLSAGSTRDLRKVLVLLGAVVETTCATIALRKSPGNLAILQHHWGGPSNAGTRTQPRWELQETEIPLLMAQMATGNLRVVRDANELRDAEIRELSRLHPDDHHAALAVPILSNGRNLRGFLLLGHRVGPHDWAEIEIRALEIIARMLQNRLPNE